MTTIHLAGSEPNLHVDEQGKLTEDRDDLEIDAYTTLLDRVHYMFCCLLPEDTSKVFDAWRDEKQARHTCSRKAWYVRSDFKEDYMTAEEPYVMQMIFFDTSNYKVDPEDDYMNYRSHLARRLTEDDDNEFDKMPKSEENPVVSTETIDEKPKPEEDSVVMDEELKPLDNPVHFRGLLAEPPSSRLEDDDELEETSNPEVYLMCYRRQVSPHTPDRHEDDHECEDKSKPKLGLVCRTSCEALCPEVTPSYTKRKKKFSKVHCSKKSIDEKLVIEMIDEKPKPQKDSMYADEPLPRTSPNGDNESVLEAPTMEKVTETAKPTLTSVEPGPPSSCGEVDDEFTETTKAEVYLLCYCEQLSNPRSDCSMLNSLSRAFCSKKSINEKLVIETIAEKPKPQKGSMFAEEPLPRTSPNDDDESVLEAPSMEEVTETAKPTLTSVEQTGMPLITEVSDSEASTLAPVEDTEVPTEDRNYGLDGKSMIDEVEFDKKPKSEENPVAFMETVSEEQKLKENSTVALTAMKDETLTPPDDPAYSREGLPGPPSSCREADDEFAETSKAEVSNLLSDCSMLNNLSRAFCSKQSIDEKLLIETIAEKPKPQKDSMYAEEPLPRTSPNDDDESVLEAATMEEVTETAKPTLISVEQTGMPLITGVSVSESSTLAPVEDTEVPTVDCNYGLDGKLMPEEDLLRDIIMVQSLVRRQAARNIVEQKPSELMIHCATAIQSAWRRYYSYSSYQCDLRNIVILQNLVRRLAVRNRHQAGAAQSTGS